MTQRSYLIESNDPRLNRHVEHDEASKAFPAQRAGRLADVLHRRNGPILDQGNLGSCTGNAMAGLLMTEPQYNPGLIFDENGAVSVYSIATQVDGFPGQWPPDDTGSSGLAVAKAAKMLGWVETYHHAFGLQHTLEALVLRPCIVGVPWYDSMFTPNANGFVEISPNASVAGGHEFLLRGISLELGAVMADNSWGENWGQRGSFLLSFDTLGRLLSEHGDATFAH